MKTYIKKPEVRKFTTITPLDDKASILSIFDDMEENVCGGLEDLSEQLGCENGELLCQLVEAIGELLGCNQRDCAQDSDCDDWEECVGGYCELEEGKCEVSADCEQHETCQDHECEETGCNHPDVNCSDYEECVDDECVPTGDCRHPHINCPSEMLCNPSGVCVDCVTNEDCEMPNTHCNDGMCIPDEGYCNTKVDCGKPPAGINYDCINNECEVCALEDGPCEADEHCCDASHHCWALPEPHCTDCIKPGQTCPPPPQVQALNGPYEGGCCPGSYCVEMWPDSGPAGGVHKLVTPDWKCQMLL